MDPKGLTTEALAARERLPFWRDAVCETFVELECESAESNNFYGSIANKTIGDIQFSDVSSSSQRVIRTRSKISHSSLDYYLISIQTEGTGVLAQDGRTAILQPSDFALYDTTRPYDLIFETSFSQLVLRIPREIVAGRLADANRLTALRIQGDRGTGRLASAFLRQLHAEIGGVDELSVSRLHASAIDLLATSIAEQVASPANCTESNVALRRRVSVFIDRNLDNPQLTCELIATSHGISERYLRKVFEASEQSVSEMIWARRLDQGRRDLVDPLKAHLSVTAIGYDVGFKDTAHFSRAFKARYHETPKAVRSTALGNPRLVRS